MTRLQDVDNIGSIYGSPVYRTYDVAHRTYTYTVETPVDYEVITTQMTATDEFIRSVPGGENALLQELIRRINNDTEALMEAHRVYDEAVKHERTEAVRLGWSG